MKPKQIITENTHNWGGLLTTCGHDDFQYRENVCYGAMFDWAERYAEWRNDKGHYDNEFDGDLWFDLKKGAYLTSYLYRYTKTTRTRARWWMNELATHILPQQWFDSGLVKAEETTDFPCIENAYRMDDCDIDWDYSGDGDSPRNYLREMVRVDVSMNFPGQIVLAVGALYRYMSECGAWLEMYYYLRQNTKMTPSQCFIVASLLMPTDGHGVGVWRQLVSGSMFEEFKAYSMPNKLLELAKLGSPFHQYGMKRQQIDTFLAFNSKHDLRGAKWIWAAYSGNIMIEGRKPDLKFDPLPIGDVHFRSRDVAGGQILFDLLKMENVI